MENVCNCNILIIFLAPSPSFTDAEGAAWKNGLWTIPAAPPGLLYVVNAHSTPV